MLKLSDRCGDTRILLDAISNDKIHLARFVLDALDREIVDSETEGVQTPLISAVFLQESPARCRFMNLLLQRGANLNLQDKSGRTPLSYACEMGYLDAVKILVKNGADPEVADSWGNTALMYAAAAGHSTVVEFLVRAFKRLGLQIDRKNKVGNSAIEVAKFLKHTECLQALLSHSRKIYDDDALAEKLSIVSISEAEHEEKPLQIHPSENRTRFPIGLTHKRSLGLRKRIQSMGSIEEYEREGDASLPSSQQSQMFSTVFTPKPPQKLKLNLPPLFYSPRPSKTPLSCASASSSGPLSILLTPFSKSTKEALEKAKKLPFDSSIRRFDDSYYQKRCSLPTSTLAPAAPEHLKPLRKSKTAENASRSLRRFTFPEFRRSSRESPEGCGAQRPECIPRSETFPLGNKHAQVGSKPSVDSISAVKCEFDLQFKAAPDGTLQLQSVTSTNLLTSAVPTNNIRA